jgi:hypothetical protein
MKKSSKNNILTLIKAIIYYLKKYHCIKIHTIFAEKNILKYNYL